MEENEYVFSMPSHCGCKSIFGKTVTLLANWNAFDYASNGFRFGPETIVVEGVSPVNDCNALKRSAETVTPEDLVSTTEESIQTPTPTEITNEAKVTNVEKRDENRIEEAKERRNYQGDKYNTYGSSYLSYGSNEGKSQGNYNQQSGGYSGQYGGSQYGGQQSQYSPQTNVSYLKPESMSQLY